MNVGERIKRRREELKMSADDLGELVGKNRATIYRYEKNEIENMPYSIIEKLAKVLRVSPAYLMGWDDNEPTKPTSEYPYFHIGVSAGLPINVDPILESSTITIPDELLGKYAGSKDIYFMKVNGDSMNKIIPHNSLIAVKQVQLNELKNGDIVVFSNCFDYSVKRYLEINDKIIFRSESTDPTFIDQIFSKDSEDLIIHGKVVAYVVTLN